MNIINTNNRLAARQNNLVTPQSPTNSTSGNAAPTQRNTIMMDVLDISDEAREAAAQARARWNSGEMTEAERQEFANQVHGGIFDPANRISERELIATQGTHNLLGGFEFVANNGQTFTARIGTDGIWLLNGQHTHHNQRPSFMRIDPSRGVPGIDQPTVRKLDFMYQIVQNLRQAMPPEDNNLYSYEGIMGNQEGLRALVDSFAAIRSGVNGQGHIRPLEDAFRVLVNNFFAESARIANLLPEGSTPNDAELAQWREQSDQAHDEALAQANIFTNAFLSNFGSQGTGGAFNTAWAIL